MVMKNRCPKCFGQGVNGLIRFRKCDLCDGDGIYPKTNTRPPTGPPPRKLPDMWQSFRETARPTVNEIRDMESKQKEVESVEEFQLGDYVKCEDKFGVIRGIVRQISKDHLHISKLEDHERVHVVEKIFTTVIGKSKDSPTKPLHYGKLDVFTYAKEHFTVEEVNAYHQITAIKYITRAGKKEGNPYEQDIKKAIVHLEECLKGEEG